MTSIKMLRRFDVPKEEILVYYGKPRFQQHLNWLADKATVKLVETPLHTNQDMRDRVHHKNAFYGSTMKIHIFTTDCDQLIWLDSDTEIFADVRDFFKLDFDILVANVPLYGYVMKKPSMEAGFPMTKRLYFAGCWATKNRTHLKIHDYYVDYWKRCFNDEFTVASVNRLELYAFNLAVLRFMHEDGGNVVEMPGDWQGYQRVYYVCHLRRGKFSPRERGILNDDDRRLFGVGDDNREWLRQ
jgi:hypothetical protein